MMKRRILCLIALLSLTLTASTAAAQVSIGVGVKGGLNGSLVDGVPEDETLDFGGQTYQLDPDFFPMFGIGGAIGLAVEARAMKYIGLETGLHYSFDNGSGNEEVNNTAGQRLLTVNQDQRSKSIRIPVLLKLAIPFPVVTPVFGLGIEVVSQTDSELEYDIESAGINKDIATSTYTLFAFSIGLEFKVQQIRIPLELRAGYNLGFDNTLSGRVSPEGESINTATFVYDGAYQGHVGIYTGIMYDFDLLL